MSARLNAEMLTRILYSTAPACDRALLAEPPLRAMFARAYREASVGGTAGLVEDVALITEPWDFDLADIKVHVRLHYGELDALTPAHLGSELSARLPQGTLAVVPGEGHLLVWKQWPHLLSSLTS